MKTGELLGIDLDSELRVLCRDQLQGSWQIPAELTRLAIAKGARLVHAERRGRRIHLRCPGAMVGADELEELCRAVDPEQPLDDRHRALEGLERSAPPLLWAAGADGARLRLTQRADGGTLSLRIGGGSRPEVSEAARGATAPELEISFGCRGFEARRAASWLRRATRFAPLEVRIDDRPPPTDFPDGLFRIRWQRPLPCRLAITRSGDAPQLWLLQHGVVATRARVPSFPAFDAAVEMSEVAPMGSSGAELRAAVTPYLPELVDLAVRMLMRLADRLPKVDATTRRRIVSLALRAAGQGLRRDEILDLPLVRVRGDGNRWLSARELEDLAGVDGLWTVADDGELAKRGTGDAVVAVLSAEERELLAGLLDIRMQTPPERPRRSSFDGLRRAVSRAFGFGVSLRRLLMGWMHGRELRDDQLSSSETALVDALRAAAGSSWSIAFVSGGGAVRRRGRRVLLPRSNPMVGQAARVVATDTGWMYPVWLALLADVAAPPPVELRAAWLRRRAASRLA